MKENAIIPFLAKKGTATQLIVDGKPFIMLGGEVHNSSSSSLSYMQQVWPALVQLNLNTAIVPVSWELFEPEEGIFDYSLIDGLINGARENNKRLIFLWFGSWKNAASTYVPSWVKLNTTRFKRSQTVPGLNQQPLSCFCMESCTADARAFAELMRYIRTIDANEQTVLMMQVQNEVGILRAYRDFSPLAQEAFIQPVPSELRSYLQEKYDILNGELKAAFNNDAPQNATWEEVFGNMGAEIFMAWHMASYVGKVAKAGQQQYDIPMFVNAWLAPKNSPIPAHDYPIGGPVPRVFDIWQCAAANIPIIAPDIYEPEFRRICGQFTVNGNPLLIPEARRDENAAANLFYAIGQHDAICFAPFGIESMVTGNAVTISGIVQAEAHNMAVSDNGRKLAQSYALLQSILPIIAEYQGTGNMAGILQDSESTQRITLGEYDLVINFNKPRQIGETPAAGIVIAMPNDEFIVLGHGYYINFYPRPGENLQIDYLSIDEGYFANNTWVQGRRLNGDELAVKLDSTPAIIKVKMYKY